MSDKSPYIKMYMARETDGLYIGTVKAFLNPRPDPNIVDDDYIKPANAKSLKPSQDILDFNVQGFWIGSSWSSVPYPTPEEPTDEDYRKAILLAIDDKTKTIIETGFSVNGQQVSLTIEDQQNFFNKFMTIWLSTIQGSLPKGTFPLQLPVWTNNDGTPAYIGIGTFDEYAALFEAGNQHIEDARQAGRDLKVQVAAMTIEQLKTFEDPRG